MAHEKAPRRAGLFRLATWGRFAIVVKPTLVDYLDERFAGNSACPFLDIVQVKPFYPIANGNALFRKASLWVRTVIGKGQDDLIARRGAWERSADRNRVEETVLVRTVRYDHERTTLAVIASRVSDLCANDSAALDSLGWHAARRLPQAFFVALVPFLRRPPPLGDLFPFVEVRHQIVDFLVDRRQPRRKDNRGVTSRVSLNSDILGVKPKY